jgi:hypothetical protein
MEFVIHDSPNAEDRPEKEKRFLYFVYIPSASLLNI